ncbi:MAG TPA: aspartate ammonia-lyase [Gemmatimonadales bacterium]|jgi:aspartate ammonia-lyase|nr:aspartate ammonia-lyase [Gemmatimonadales bacterium]
MGDSWLETNGSVTERNEAMSATRIERDPLGELPVPAGALYGIQTERARHNFPISNLRPLAPFVDAVLWIKKAAALTHKDTRRLEGTLADAIVRAADEILAGSHRDQFVVDPYQAGAGTSHNMNCNEVLANRANELLGGKRGEYKPVHPNDHVNMAQSTNDVIPTAIRLAALAQLPGLLAALERLARALLAKGAAFDGIVKAGRTHLQDATPVRLGQEFTAYGHTVERNRERIARAAEDLRDLGIGGTAVGTGLNAEPKYPGLMVKHLRAITGLELREGKDRVQLMQSMGDATAFSGALRTYAVDLGKIASDLRFLASGPRTGLAEIGLPAVQPGSSIMPGKVNPSIAEMVNMVCFQAIGNDVTVATAAEAGQLELNVMMPVIAHNLLFSMLILTNGSRVLAERCVDGIEADAAQCAYWLERSPALVTALAPKIGYAEAAKLAKEAVAKNITVRQLVIEKGLLKGKELDEVLDLRAMTELGVPGERK